MNPIRGTPIIQTKTDGSPMPILHDKCDPFQHNISKSSLNHYCPLSSVIQKNRLDIILVIVGWIEYRTHIEDTTTFLINSALLCLFINFTIKNRMRKNKDAVIGSIVIIRVLK